MASGTAQGGHAYFPHIDGLRAIAVSAVVLFHAFPGALPGGFLGVDVFFVISGYLITGIIWRGLQAGRFSFGGFYARRVRRIFPALLLVLAATAVAGLAILPFAGMVQLGRHMAAAALFLPNIQLLSEAGYFDAAAQVKPLLHLWSLGVEEQFYILWPLLLYLCLRLRVNARLVLLVAVLVSLGYAVLVSAQDPVTAFYSPFSRAWELAIGGLVALTPRSHASPRLDAALGYGGLALVGLSLATIGEAGFAPWHALGAVLGAALLVAAGPSSPVATHLLAIRPLVALGLVSYPLYLWHWPVLTLARIADPHLSTAALAALVAASLVLSVLTYLLVERPLQARLGLRRAAAWLLPGMAIAGVAGALLAFTDVRLLAYPPQMRQVLRVLNYDYLSDARVGTCWLDPARTDQSFDACGFTPGWAGQKLALWGDSHSGRLYPGLATITKGEREVAEYVTNACPPMDISSGCARRNAAALAAMAREKPDTVILFARWASYGTDYLSGPTAEKLDATVGKLRDLGARVVIVGPFPSYPGNLPEVVFDRWNADRSAPIPTRLKGLPDAKTAAVDRSLRAFAAERGLAFVSLVDFLCTGDGCATTWSGKPDDLLSWDYGHLTTDAARHVGRHVLEALDRPQ